MSEPATTAPQAATQESRMDRLRKAVESSGEALMEAASEWARSKHAHDRVIVNSHEYTSEQMFASASAARQNQANTVAALEAFVDAQIGMYREIDKAGVTHE